MALRPLFIRGWKQLSAYKGFVSLDRTNLEDPNDNTYHIVCMPNKNIALPDAFNLCTYKSNNPNLLNYVGQNISLLEEITLL